MDKLIVPIPEIANHQLPDASLLQFYNDLENRIYWIDDEINELSLLYRINEKEGWYISNDGYCYYIRIMNQETHEFTILYPHIPYRTLLVYCLRAVLL